MNIVICAFDRARLVCCLAQCVVDPAHSNIAVTHAGAMPQAVRAGVIIKLIAVPGIAWVGRRLVSQLQSLQVRSLEYHPEKDFEREGMN